MKALIFFFLSCLTLLEAKVECGIDVFLKEECHLYKNKKVGLILNHTSVDKHFRPTWMSLRNRMSIHAIFSPEHGFNGNHHAGELVGDDFHLNVPIYSLHGKTRRPTKKMLKGLDVLIYDIQCIGSRSYTYESTLFYAMEEAAKEGIEVVVLDRPNPMGGLIVDGPILDESARSFVGYINVPYCHGMTIGELAQYFNEEYKIGCKLKVIPMKNWKREMHYSDTGLSWIPPSPNIPEPDTPLYYPTTGILGEMQILNIGVGYTLPFKVIGAPWIDAEVLSQKLNEQKLPGVKFIPFYFKPFHGKFKGQNLKGVKIQITDKAKFRPITVQYLLLGMIKSLYPVEFKKGLPKVNPVWMVKILGSRELWDVLCQEKYIGWKLIELSKKNRGAFLKKRKKYLIQSY